MNKALTTALAVLLLSGNALALSPPPPLPEASLVAFYQAMDGDNWLRNDGWLDEDTPICEWYGITCRNNPDWGYSEIARLELPNNGLQGAFEPHVEQMISQVQVRVDLSGNRIEGQLAQLPAINVLNLANNQLSGPLPEAAGAAPGSPASLNLSRNQFEGEVPDSWAQLGIQNLNLADNRLSGMPEGAFLALSETAHARELFLENNDFAGELPEWLIGLNLFGENSLNLCWNEFTIDDEELLEWVQMRHLGGADLSCLERARRLPNPELSGSWFYPPRSGEGFSLMLMENDTALLYWFSHISQGRQKWLFQVADIEDESLIFDGLYRTRGIFGQGFGEDGSFWTGGSRLRLDWLEDGRLHGEYTIQYSWPDVLREGDVIVTPPPLPPRVSRQDHRQLTRLAGSRCDNVQPMQWVSGAWFNPARSGEGFLVEVNEDGRGLVYWFTYTPDGLENGDPQAWMIGDGHFEGQQLIIANLVQPRDLADAMPDDSAGIEVLPWGELIIDFHDPLSATLQFDSELSDYGSGQYPLKRLATARLAQCEA